MSGVCGIDPSLSSTGLAWISPAGELKVSCVTSTGKNNESVERTVERIFYIANEVVDFVNLHKPDLVVIENPSFASQYGKPHERSGLWWRIVDALVHDDYKIARVAPQTRAIYATGDGRSKKAVVLAHVREHYTDILGARVANDDVADAIVLADLGALQKGYPLDVPPATSERHTRALTGVLWPVL